jgi:ligand-binding sensor domain-containing protein
MRFLPSIILLCFLFFNPFEVYTQNYFFKDYGLEEGLPNTQLHDILQAKDNTLWVTSAYGVIQFDGKEFTSFTKDNGLCSNQIISVFEDSKGRIWCGSWQYDGVSIIENGKVRNPTDPLFKKIRGVMVSAFEDQEGNIWMFGYSTIIKYDNKKFELIYETPEVKNDEVYYQNINSVVEGNNPNTIYMASTSHGIAKVTLSPFRIEKIFNSDSHNINNICFSTFKDTKGVVWVGYYGGVLSIINDKIKTYDLPGDFNNNRVWSITRIKKVIYGLRFTVEG